MIVYTVSTVYTNDIFKKQLQNDCHSRYLFQEGNLGVEEHIEMLDSENKKNFCSGLCCTISDNILNERQI